MTKKEMLDRTNNKILWLRGISLHANPANTPEITKELEYFEEIHRLIEQAHFVLDEAEQEKEVERMKGWLKEQKPKEKKC